MLRRMLVMPLLLVALALGAGGCEQFRVLSGAVRTITTTSIQNPVTPKMLDNAQKALNVASDALNIYGNLCVKQRIAQTCWDDIESIQVYTKQLPPLLTSARKFVRSNDHVNARIVYDTVQGLLSDIRRESLAKGVI